MLLCKDKVLPSSRASTPQVFPLHHAPFSLSPFPGDCHLLLLCLAPFPFPVTTTSCPCGFSPSLFVCFPLRPPPPVSPSMPLSAEEMTNLREAFALFETPPGGGSMPASSLGTLLRALGYHPTQAAVAAAAREADADGDGSLLLAEVVTAVTAAAASASGRLTAEDLRAAFRVFDKDGSGSLSATELRAVLTSMGEKMTDEEVDEMLTEADVDGDGKINYAEFSAKLLS